ncbi:GMP/IMP nucleotidase [Pseudomonas sp. C27(2019)]|uniref:GMP/IMP nucleotidase n=1 Tax=Pseudomonas sp. C27(2019) TaxID=2604941 RepID=UPI0012480D59|nr:GMP/IMP nucleotidase [Pseudomonas sp. C27(2019)]QEY60301.1 GMP/IMP nucleotidase [Pseudomonas sp. C27(2019)]
MQQLPWEHIDTVLLDMDGTLLDLHFDNVFWLDYMPQYYADKNGLSRAEADAYLQPLMASYSGQLNWYCVEFWSKTLDLPIKQMKRDTAHLIDLRANSEQFLLALKQAGKRRVLVTNAHRDSLHIKLEKVHLEPLLDIIVSSHDYGYPKEDQRFWDSLSKQVDYQPARSLFIDDSLPVLRSAQRYGIGHLRAVLQPDSQGPQKNCEEFIPSTDLLALVSNL